MNNILDNKIYIKEYIPKECHTIIVFSHGMGTSKEEIDPLSQELNDNGIGIICYDQPCHGEDKTPGNKDFFIQCMAYLDKVIDYTKNKYSKDIVLAGHSFGCFVILSYLLKHKYQAIFISPAVDMYYALNKYLDMSFEKSDVVKVFDLDFYKKAYEDIKEKQHMIDKYKYKNIRVLQGDSDIIIDIEKVKEFCNRNDIELEIINGGKHRLYGNIKRASSFIIKVINDEKKI